MQLLAYGHYVVVIIVTVAMTYHANSGEQVF